MVTATVDENLVGDVGPFVGGSDYLAGVVNSLGAIVPGWDAIGGYVQDTDMSHDAYKAALQPGREYIISLTINGAINDYSNYALFALRDPDTGLFLSNFTTTHSYRGIIGDSELFTTYYHRYSTVEPGASTNPMIVVVPRGETSSYTLSVTDVTVPADPGASGTIDESSGNDILPYNTSAASGSEFYYSFTNTQGVIIPGSDATGGYAADGVSGRDMSRDAYKAELQPGTEYVISLTINGVINDYGNRASFELRDPNTGNYLESYNSNDLYRDNNGNTTIWTTEHYRYSTADSGASTNPIVVVVPLGETASYTLSITESISTTGSNGVTITDVNLGVYRFYNSATGTHFYSSDYSEAVSVNENLSAFSYENVAFKGVDSSDPSAVSFYRFYNTLTGTHFFTSDSAEKDSVIANLPQYNYEGVAYYLHNAPDANDIALHRFFNTQTGTHFYTASESEKTTVINTLIDYSYEGIVGYVDIA